MEAIALLSVETSELKLERDDFMKAKDEKAKAENAVLESIVEAVRPAIPAIVSKVEAVKGWHLRGLDIGGGVFLMENAKWGVLVGPDIRTLETQEVLDRTSLSAVLAVLLSAVRAQAGKLDPRTDQIRRETGILEGIAAAFRAGGVR